MAVMGDEPREKKIIIQSKVPIRRPTQGTGIKMLTSKQMFQRLPVALTQVEAGNTSENLLNEICQIIYSLYRAEEVTKKVYNNITNSVQLS